MKIVLHICCGVCAAGAAERLISDGHEVTGFFFNPNIQPFAEYQRRLIAARRVAEELAFPLEVGRYDSGEWIRDTMLFRDEPEGGKRCRVCFWIRLKETFLWMERHRADAFATTLSISPHKSFGDIRKIGVQIGGEKFLAEDFKKRDGFKRSIERAKEWDLYRQHYCGCMYSMGKPA